MLHRFLLYAALASAGTALAVPAAAQFAKDQITAGRQELNKSQSTAASGGTQPVAASSENTNANPGVSSTHSKAKKKKDKNKAKPAPSEQEEEFNRMLLGIHG
jgi:hypothetical protein